MDNPFDPSRTDLGMTNDIIHDPERYKGLFRWKLEYLKPEQIIRIWREIDPYLDTLIREHGYGEIVKARMPRIWNYIESGHKLPALVVELQRDGSYNDLVEGMHRVQVAKELNLDVPVYFIQILYKARWNS